MIRKPNPENLAKLSPEQRAIWDKWQEENETSEKIIQGGLKALAANDQKTASEMFEQLDKLIPHECEHGRSIYKDCKSCEEIEKIVFPEYYNTDGTRMPDEIIYKTFMAPRNKNDIN